MTYNVMPVHRISCVHAWYDKYVKIRKYMQVLYQKVEHTNFYVNIPN